MKIFVLALLGFFAISSTFAETADCQKIKTSAKRLECYEKNEKEQTKIRSAETSAKAQPAAETKKPKWELEPDSFLGVKLGASLSSSVMACPTEDATMMMSNKPYAYRKIDANAFENSGLSVCQNPLPKQSWGIGGEYEFAKVLKSLGFKSVVFKEASGSFVMATVRFRTEGWDAVSKLLIDKFGKPHLEKKGQMILNNGSKLDTEEISWLGSKVAIVASSLSDRDVNSGGIFNYGQILFISQEYADSVIKQQEESNSKAKANL